jgi:hypothetical protein
LKADSSGLTLSLILASQKDVDCWAWLELDIDGHQLESYETTTDPTTDSTTTATIDTTTTTATATTAERTAAPPTIAKKVSIARKVHRVTLTEVKSGNGGYTQAKNQLRMRAKFLDAVASVTNKDSKWGLEVELVAAILSITQSGDVGTVVCAYDDKHTKIENISLKKMYFRL